MPRWRPVRNMAGNKTYVLRVRSAEAETSREHRSSPEHHIAACDGPQPLERQNAAIDVSISATTPPTRSQPSSPTIRLDTTEVGRPTDLFMERVSDSLVVSLLLLSTIFAPMGGYKFNVFIYDLPLSPRG